MAHCPCYAVLFTPRFHHAGVHYIDADTHEQEAERVVMRRDGRVVWAGSCADIAEVRRFDNRKQAEHFHRLMRHRLLKGRGHASGVARSPRAGRHGARSAVIEGLVIRLQER